MQLNIKIHLNNKTIMIINSVCGITRNNSFTNNVGLRMTTIEH